MECSSQNKQATNEWTPFTNDKIFKKKIQKKIQKKKKIDAISLMVAWSYLRRQVPIRK